MGSYFFISDIHLDADSIEAEQKKEKRLLSFLKYVEHNGVGLFIVGDLFDFWFEYKTVIPRKYYPVLNALRQLVLKGVRVEFVMGNHDFWLESFFPEQLGIPVHAIATELIIDGRKIFIAHGDGIAENDTGYRLLKRILRHPLNIKLYRILHPDLGFALAGFFSKLSRKHRAFDEDDADYIRFAQQQFENGYDGVILGHTHRPMIEERTGHTFINLGDWISHFSYGEWSGKKLHLRYWPGKLQTEE